MEKGKTFAVLGCGVDICYPREHIGLYMDILEQGGGILSEFPPGTPPLAVNFPLRNRIISGLSDVILIMEQENGVVHSSQPTWHWNRGRRFMLCPDR